MGKELKFVAQVITMGKYRYLRFPTEMADEAERLSNKDLKVTVEELEL